MKNGKNIMAAICLMVAVLTKETAMLVVGAIFLSEVFGFYKHRSMSKRWYLILVPAVVYTTWRVWLMLLTNQGMGPPLKLKQFIGVPFEEFLSFFIETVFSSGQVNTLWFFEFFLILVFTLTVIQSFWSTEAEDYEKY